jgi:hypothetical protein
MLDLHAIKAQDISALNPSEWASFAEQLLVQINEQSRHIAAQAKRIDSDAQAIKWRDAKIESITFQLARLKAWKFGAKTERMNAEQRSIFEEALAADEASLEAQLAALQPAAPAVDTSAPDKKPRRQPKREALPARAHALALHRAFAAGRWGSRADRARLGTGIGALADSPCRGAIPTSNTVQTQAAPLPGLQTGSLSSVDCAAERVLRDYVIKRKLSYCTRSKRGMDFTERIFSTVQTCKMQGRVAYDFITEAVQSWCAQLRPPSLVPEHIHLHHTYA